MKWIYTLLILISLTSAICAEPLNSKMYTFGRAKVYAIEDKQISFHKDLFVTRDKELIKQLLPTGECKASSNTFLIIVDNESYLIDTGSGVKNGGSTAEILRKIGIPPEKITKVIISHLHKDHVGGLIDAKGNKVFPNASVYVPHVDYVFWNSADGKKRDKNLSKFMADVKSAYGRKLYQIKTDDAFFNGITPINGSGHTPGHMMIAFDFGLPFIFIADTIYCIDVQLINGDINMKIDHDQRMARILRNNTMDELSVEKKIVLSSHIKFPGIIKFTPYDLNKNMGYYYYEDNLSEDKK